MFILMVLLYAFAIVLSTAYVYLRLDYVRSYEEPQKITNN